MATNKVVYDGDTLMDLTSDTVTAATLAAGETAHDASGALIVGVATPVTLVQETGQNETAVMSQKAVTKEIERVDILKPDVSAWKPVNVLANAQWGAAGTYWGSGGNIQATSSTTKYTATTELIPIASGASYETSGFIGEIKVFSANKTLLLTKSTSAMSSQITFDAPENAAYIGVSYRNDILTTSALVSAIKVMQTTMSEEDYKNLPVRADALKALYGKTVVCFGDSLFGMYRGEDSAPAFVAKETGATVHNVGFGGCRMSIHPSSGYAEFSMWALAKAVAEQDFSTQEAAAASGSSYFPQQLAILKGIDFNEVDVVVIHYGTNDFAGSIAIDNDSDPLSYYTICGALRYSLDKLLTAYPHLRIYVSLPVFRFWTNDSGAVTYSDAYLNNNGKTLEDVCSALAGVAHEHNLPVVDGYHGLGIYKQNASAYLSDGTHHNAAGRERFGAFIGANLVSQQSATAVGGGNAGVTEQRVQELIDIAISGAIGGAY